jgi:cytidine deaminase
MLCQICSSEESCAPQPLGELLPKSFGPADLFSNLNECNLFTSMRSHNLILPSKVSADRLATAALIATNQSYCPYSHSAAGVALAMEDGQIHTGYSVENAAYNPTLSPLHCAIVALMCSGDGSGGSGNARLGGIAKCTLIEGRSASEQDTSAPAQPHLPIDTRDAIWASTVSQVLRSIAPGVEVRVLHAIKSDAVETSTQEQAQPPAAVYVTPQLAPVTNTRAMSGLELGWQDCALSPKSGRTAVATPNKGAKMFAVDLDAQLGMGSATSAGASGPGLQPPAGKKRRAA